MPELHDVVRRNVFRDEKETIGPSFQLWGFGRVCGGFQNAADGFIRERFRVAVFVDVDRAQAVTAADDHEPAVGDAKRHGPSAGKGCQQGSHQDKGGDQSCFAPAHDGYVARSVRHDNSNRMKIGL